MKKSKYFLMAMVALALSLGMVLSGCAGLSKADATISFDPSTMRNVMRVSDDGIEKGWLSVSKDGQKLLYCEQPVEMNPATDTKNMSSRILYLRNASVFAKTPVVESFTYAPAWYENGTNFVYVLRNEDGTTQLIKGSVGGSGKTFITRNPIGAYDNHPTVRNGIIACDTWINNERQIVTLRDNGTEITILGPGSYPSWHPTENKLVFIRDNGVWEMDTETTQQTQLYARSEKDIKDRVNVNSPAYSEDGQYIVFTKGVKIGSSYYWHLFRIDAEGNSLTELTQGSVSTFSPAYGTGNQIFFIANAGGKYEIWSALISEE